MDIFIIIILLTLIYLILYNKPEGFIIGSRSCVNKNSIDPFYPCEGINDQSECENSIYYDIETSKTRQCEFDNNCKKPTSSNFDCDLNYCQGVQVTVDNMNNSCNEFFLEKTALDYVQNPKLGQFIPIDCDKRYIKEGDEYIQCESNINTIQIDQGSDFFGTGEPAGSWVDTDDIASITQTATFVTCKPKRTCQPTINNNIIRKVWENLANGNLIWWYAQLLTSVFAVCAVLGVKKIYRTARYDILPWCLNCDYNEIDSDSDSDLDLDSDSDLDFSIDEESQLRMPINEEWEIVRAGEQYTYVNTATGSASQTMPEELTQDEQTIAETLMGYVDGIEEP
jgi:hypothetical protein